MYLKVESIPVYEAYEIFGKFVRLQNDYVIKFEQFYNKMEIISDDYVAYRPFRSANLSVEQKQ